MKKFDLTAWIGIVVCIGLLGWSLQRNAQLATQQRAAQKIEDDRKAKIAETQKEINKLEGEVQGAGNAVAPSKATADSTSTDTVDQPAIKTAELKTEDFLLSLTSRGAGIQTAQLLKHKNKLGSDDYMTLNHSRQSPVGALSSKPNEIDDSIWSIKTQTADSITFETQAPNNLLLEKTFRIPADAPRYEVVMDLTVHNTSSNPVELSETDTKFIYLGGAEPTHFNEWSMQIGLFYRDNHYHTKTVDFFGGKGKMLGLFGHADKPYAILPSESKISENFKFAGVHNQFFTTLIHAKVPQTTQLWGDKYKAVIDGQVDESATKKMFGCELALGLPNVTLGADERKTLSYDIYMGPKEEKVLEAATSDRHFVMNYDQIPIFGKVFGWAIKPLAGALHKALNWFQSWTSSWGVAIILLTIAVRLLMWPIYAKSSRSMKRMSKLAPLQKDLKEKYADDPQKLNQETMKLYREYNINPMGGCLPAFIQLPVFLGFYRMLWGAVELRHQSFFGFVEDLTMPDELTMIAGFPINILPILMAVASWGQMAMMPKTGDSTQRMVFMMMPWMFLIFCYNFASGLALYWTVSNVFTIIQTFLMNKLPEPELKKGNSKKDPSKKGFMEKLQDRLEEAQQMAEQQKSGGGGAGATKSLAAGASKTKKKNKDQQNPQPNVSSDRGARHTKPKKRKR